jgi:lysozyme
MTTNQKAFLDMLAFSEIGPALLAGSDNGYDVLVGGTLFRGYADHPRKLIKVREGLWSTAAGRYQILTRNYDAYRRLLKLKDFSPASQDAIALQMIKECKAIEDIDNGRFDNAVVKTAHIWASLPGAGYHQHENKINALRAAYVAAGGKLEVNHA